MLVSTGAPGTNAPWIPRDDHVCPTLFIILPFRRPSSPLFRDQTAHLCSWTTHSLPPGPACTPILKFSPLIFLDLSPLSGTGACSLLENLLLKLSWAPNTFSESFLSVYLSGLLATCFHSLTLLENLCQTTLINNSGQDRPCSALTQLTIQWGAPPWIN